MAASLTKTQSYAADQWAAQTSGNALTVTLVADDYLWIRQTLATSDTSVTPTLTEMTVEVTVSGTTEIEDISLDLATYYQARSDLASILSATDGTAFQDLETFLKMYGQSIEDLPTNLAAYFQSREDISTLLKGVALDYKNLSTVLQAQGLSFEDLNAQLKSIAWESGDLFTVLEAVSPTLFEDLEFFLKVTDGLVFNNLSTKLMARKRTPQYKAAVAQRLRSVISEVT